MPEGSSRSSATRRDPCARISNANRGTVVRGALDDVAPWPVVNGPLFAVSRKLAEVLTKDAIPSTYLESLLRTTRVRGALARKGGLRKSNFGCWPVMDTILGLWVTRISSARNVSIQLVNTPFMVQHHPWPATVHGAFGNTSIVLHGLKRERNQKKYRAIAEERGLGPFIPFRRKCRNCTALGWSKWPGSPQASWTCCGCDATMPKSDCDQRMGQRHDLRAM